MLFISLCFLLFTNHSMARIEVYESEARNSSGAIEYKERHTATFSGPKVLEARTEYLGPNGKVIADMQSNFRKDLTLPEYTFKDFRSNSTHGIDIREGQIVLWRKEEGSEREEKIFDRSKFDKDALVVGCQGLHYYLIENMQRIQSGGKIQVKYLIPGKIDYFSFTLQKEKEDKESLHLRLSVNSLFLKPFISSLNFSYNKSNNRLTEYTGLSNIPDDKGEVQKVKIEYSYIKEPPTK